MFDILKSFGISIFIGFIFVFSIAAQTPENEISVVAEDALASVGNEIETSTGKSKNPFSKKYLAAEDSTKSAISKVSETVDATNWKLPRGAKELNAELGYSPFQPTFFAKKEYDTSDRSFGILTLRGGRVIGTAKRVTYEFQIGITPVALAFHNEVKNPAFQSATLTPNAVPTVRQTTYGFAFSPVGFRFLFLPEKRLKPFAAVHAGFIFFKKPVPLPESTSYDFTGDFGGGLQYQIKKNKAINFGYMYYHISNMNIGKLNPGYNAQIFYAGYSFFYK
ncbi:MAG: acyloxyacyl hydrolase [Pyrinomonadaceae bacterium]